MISFIVEGFDPWEYVHELLEAIALVVSELQEDYEVIFISSFLLEISQEECVKICSSLFGKNFEIFCDTSLNLFNARCMAQEMASGDVFCYLSPSIEISPDSLKEILAEITRVPDKRCLCPCLLFQLSQDVSPRVLSAGYGETPEGSLCSVMVGARCEEVAQWRHIPTGIFPSYCFCSRIPFYRPEDAGKTSFERHVAACLRNRPQNGAIVLGNVTVSLRERYFPMYLRLYSSIKVDFLRSSFDFLSLAELLERNVTIGPYFDFVMDKPCHCEWKFGSEIEMADAVFWEILRWGSPDLIAAASHLSVKNKSLMALADFSLWRASSLLYEAAISHVQERIRQFANDVSVQALYRVWLETYKDNSFFAVEHVSLLKSFWKSKYKLRALKSLFSTIAAGLVGYRSDNT